MKTLDFSIPLLGLDGKPAGNDVVNGGPPEVQKMIGNLLANSQDPDAIGTLELAKKIYNSSGPIDIEEAEYKKVKEMLNKSRSSVLLKAHIETILKGK